MNTNRMTDLQRRAYAAHWSNSGPRSPAMDILPSGERIGLSLNK
jgi:hypothetical protein